MVSIRKNISNNLKITIGLGPYCSYGIGGKTKKKLHSGVYFDGSTEMMWDTFGNGTIDKNYYWIGETLKRFDFGAGLNFDVQYNKIIFGIGFESGIIDIINDYYTDLNYRNVNFNFSVGYRF